MTVKNLRTHYEQIFETELNSLKLGDTVEFALDGPGMVLHPQGQGLTLGWNLMLALKHNVLIGKEPVALHVPIMGMLPPEQIFREAAKFLLENARNERHKMSSTIPDEAPNPLQGRVLPPGAPVPGGNDVLPKNVTDIVGKNMADLLNAGPGLRASAEGRKVGGD